MRDAIGRDINYLRISITDRCNFRCIYCMPEEGVPDKSHSDILRLEEIIQFVKAVLPLGINKIRITGGEPLVRKGVVDFISNVKSIGGIGDLSMTTNASLLSPIARDLKSAGLDRVNISLDSLRSERFKMITRRDMLSDVFEGIDSAIKADLTPVKVNCVVMRGFNDDEIGDFVNLTRDYPVYVRFIELMPLGESVLDERFVSVEEIKQHIDLELEETNVSAGAGPARYYKVRGAAGAVGFITPISKHFCSSCNRVRLTADGKLKPCLESDIEIDIKNALRENKGKKELQRLFKEALMCKPVCHHMNSHKTAEHTRMMWQIGG
ncbi:MAG: GTP 3',8-cyclase MoaA [Thermoanaerobacterales bacterium]|jgi:cyclic pyranopterin phosphate synthase|nr:GTP 3',8-cyclase MoaA [Thermoanaerobacterales bacterium]